MHVFTALPSVLGPVCVQYLLPAYSISTETVRVQGEVERVSAGGSGSGRARFQICVEIGWARVPDHAARPSKVEAK